MMTRRASVHLLAVVLTLLTDQTSAASLHRNDNNKASRPIIEKIASSNNNAQRPAIKTVAFLEAPQFDGAATAAFLRDQTVKAGYALNGLASQFPPLAWLQQMLAGTFRVPRHSAAATLNGCAELTRALPGQHADDKRQAWMGFVAGGVCSLASIAACGICAWLACLEIACRTGKTAVGALAAQLATGAHFGAMAARRELTDGGGAMAAAIARAGAAAAAEEVDPEHEHHQREESSQPEWEGYDEPPAADQGEEGAFED